MSPSEVQTLLVAVTSWDGGFERDGICSYSATTGIAAGDPVIVVNGGLVRCLPGMVMRGIAMHDAAQWDSVTVQLLRRFNPQMPPPLAEDRVKEIICAQIDYDYETRRKLTGIVLSTIEAQKQADEVFRAAPAPPDFVTAPGSRRFA